jgi:hypothetical protein
MGVADEQCGAGDAGRSGRGVDRGVDDGLDGAASWPRAARAFGAGGHEGGTEVGLAGGGVVDNRHHLVDVHDDEVLRRGGRETGPGGLDDEPAVVEQLGGVALGQYGEVACGLAEEGRERDELGRDHARLPPGRHQRDPP